MNEAPEYSTATAGPRAGTVAGGGSFLPDFCQRESLLPVMVIAELLAIVLAAAQQNQSWEDRLVDLGLMSLFVQWVALCDVAVLCALRKPLRERGDRVAAIVGFLALQAVTVLLSLAMAWITRFTGLSLVLPPNWFSAQLGQNLVISVAVTGVALRYFYLQHQLRLRLAAEAEARIQALQARIRPHFLFNSMNTIASLTRIDPGSAELAVQDLAELFRASLADRDRIGLDEELELVKSYLRIEALRLGERLKVDWQIAEDCSGPMVPALSIQPLVENAIYHGVENLPAGGTVAVAVRRDSHDLLVSVENPVVPERRHQRGNRMALDNVSQRLALAYDGQQRLRVEESADRYRVELRIPASG